MSEKLPWKLTAEEWQHFKKDPESFRGKPTALRQNAEARSEFVTIGVSMLGKKPILEQHDWTDTIAWAKTSMTTLDNEPRREPTPEAYRAKMFKHWSAALVEAEAKISVFGTSLARRLTVKRLKALVAENAPAEEKKEQSQHSSTHS